MRYENKNLLRTLLNYEQDLRCKGHGIEEECVFNQMKNYHCVLNSAPDIQHDFNEGNARYDLGKMFYKFIYQDKIFSLKEFNKKKNLFVNICNDRNTIPDLTEARIKDRYLIMTSSEMLFLVENLGLIIGDIIPKKNKTWELFITLRRIMEIVMDTEVAPGSSKELKNLVIKHRSICKKLFPDDSVPFKEHVLIHYEGLREKLGPLNEFCCIRFEGFHR